MKGLIYSIVHSLIFQILSVASLLQRGFKLLQCNVNEEKNSTEVSSITEYEQHDWRNSPTALKISTTTGNNLLTNIEVKCHLSHSPNQWISYTTTGSVGRRVSIWRHVDNSHVQYCMDTSLVSTEHAELSIINPIYLFPVYWLGVIVHLSTIS